MSQTVRMGYHDPRDAKLFNDHLAAAVHEGVLEGFSCDIEDDTSLVSIRAGKLVTRKGETIQETTDRIGELTIGENDEPGDSTRLDVIVCRYMYEESWPDQPVATYHILEGTASLTDPVLPAWDQFETPLAIGKCVGYTSKTYDVIAPYPRVWRVNHTYDHTAGTWKITKGALLTMRIMVVTGDLSSVTGWAPGLRIDIIAAGTLQDLDEIAEDSWTLTIMPDALMAEIIAARGTMDSLDDRLDVSLNEDGTYRDVGILAAVIAEVVAARGSKTSLDARLDISMREAGNLLNGLFGLGLLNSSQSAPGTPITTTNPVCVQVDNSTIEIHEPTDANHGGHLQVKAGGITDNELATDAVETAKILNGAVTHLKIGSTAVWTANILNGNVTEAKIGTGAVTETKIDAGAVTEDKIGTDAVTHEKIADDAVRAHNIYNGQVYPRHFAAREAGRSSLSTTLDIPDGNTVVVNFDTPNGTFTWKNGVGGVSVVTGSSWHLVADDDRTIRLRISVAVHVEYTTTGAASIAELGVYVDSGSGYTKIANLDRLHLASGTLVSDFQTVLKGSCLISLAANDSLQIKLSNNNFSDLDIMGDMDASAYNTYISFEEC